MNMLTSSSYKILHRPLVLGSARSRAALNSKYEFKIVFSKQCNKMQQVTTWI